MVVDFPGQKPNPFSSTYAIQHAAIAKKGGKIGGWRADQAPFPKFFSTQIMRFYQAESMAGRDR
jgi:hypothetical protein